MISKSGKIKVLGLTSLGVVLVVASGLYYQYTENYPSSDDAYVNANVIYMAAEVGGKVTAVNVQNYEYVTQGQILFELDPKPYQYSKDHASAIVAVDEARADALSDQVKVAEANWEKAKADLFVAKENNERVSTLVKNHQASDKDGDQAMGTYLAAQAEVSATEESYLEAQKDLLVQKHQIESDEALLKTADLNLSRTKITAPASGYLSQFFLRPGGLVNAGDNLFELVDDSAWWIDANYKETQLDRIKPGQSSTIKMDLYPGEVFQGKVLSISPSSGSSFSLLPPENATGNWVKVVQRYPVKIQLLLTPDQKSRYQPRVGASATVKVDAKT